MTEVLKTKEEAIEFAKKYLEDRRQDYAKNEICQMCKHPIKNTHTHKANTVSGVTVIENKIAKAWDVAVEYILLDIIPHIYGEALD